MIENHQLIEGGSFSDERGTLQFVNNFNFKGIKRFYTVSQPNTSVIRAWQGHKIESKYFFVSKGKILISWVKIDNWDNPDKKLKSVNKSSAIIFHKSLKSMQEMRMGSRHWNLIRN